MKDRPNLNIFRSLLFAFDIDNPDNDSENRQDTIISKDINNTKELTELFDTILKPEYLAYIPEARAHCIEILEYYLNTDESFDSLFDKVTTYFDDDVENQRQFMQTLYSCLKRYNAET